MSGAVGETMEICSHKCRLRKIPMTGVRRKVERLKVDVIA